MLEHIPIGYILKTPCTPHVPDGLTLCLGQRLKRSDYPEAFAKIGLIYTHDDDGVHFDLPHIPMVFEYYVIKLKDVKNAVNNHSLYND